MSEINEMKKLYKTEFKELYRKKDGKGIHDLFEKNPEIKKYLSNRECRNVHRMFLDGMSLVLEKAINEIKLSGPRP